MRPILIEKMKILEKMRKRLEKKKFNFCCR